MIGNTARLLAKILRKIDKKEELLERKIGRKKQNRLTPT